MAKRQEKIYPKKGRGLRNCGREVVVWRGSKRIVFIGDIKKRKKRQGKRIYGKEVEEVLKKIWYILDFPCGRRLADYMGEILPKLEKCGEIEVNEEVREAVVKNFVSCWSPFQILN